MNGRDAGRSGSPVRRWHRHLGLLVSVPVVLVAITGMMLAHTAELGLASRTIAFGPLLAWYGLDSEPEIETYAAGAHWVSCVGERTFVDRHPLAVASGCPVGALESSGVLVVATPDDVLLVSPEGELIERLGGVGGAPAGGSAAGILADGAVVVDGPDGLRVADRELLRWRPLADRADVSWSRPVSVPPELRQDLVTAYRRQWLTAERLVRDLHSGRLFGRWGVYVMDGAALLLLVLVVSGLRLWRRGTNGAARRSDRGRRPL